MNSESIQTTTINIMGATETDMENIILEISNLGYGFDWDGNSSVIEVHDEPYAVTKITETIKTLGFEVN